MTSRPEFLRPQRVLRQVPQTVPQEPPPPQPTSTQPQPQPARPRLSIGRPPITTTTTRPVVGNTSQTPLQTMPQQSTPAPISTLSTANPPPQSRYAAVNNNSSSDIMFTPRKTTLTQQYQTTTTTTTNQATAQSRPLFSTPVHSSSITATTAPTYQATNQQQQQQIVQLKQSLAETQDELARYKSHHQALQISFTTQQTTISTLEAQLHAQIEQNNQLIAQQSELKERVVEDVLQFFESHGLDVVSLQHRIQSSFRDNSSSSIAHRITNPNYSCHYNNAAVQSSMQVYRQNAEDFINSTATVAQLLQPSSAQGGQQQSAQRQLGLIADNNPIALSQQLDSLIVSLGGSTHQEYKAKFQERLRHIELLSATAEADDYSPMRDGADSLEAHVDQFDQEFSTQLQTQYQNNTNNYIENYLNPLGLGLCDTTLQPLPGSDSATPTTTRLSSPSTRNRGQSFLDAPDDIPLMYYNNEKLPDDLLSCDLLALCDKLTQIEQSSAPLLEFGMNPDSIEVQGSGDQQLLQQATDFGLEDMYEYIGLDRPPAPQ